jgi:heat shock protein HtpX
MKRILLFLATNLAVLFVLSIVARVLGIDAYVIERGGNWTGLLAFAALFGFGGAFVSLLISKWSAKRGALDFSAVTPGRNTAYFPRISEPPAVRY